MILHVNLHYNIIPNIYNQSDITNLNKEVKRYNNRSIKLIILILVPRIIFTKQPPIEAIS